MSKHQLTELATGERVISERVPGVRSVALGFWVGAGSRDEPDARAGVSHFIEHLLFKGSSRYSAQEIAEIFDELGGELNAATSRETTVVYARVPDDRLETALDVMADMVYRPSFDELDSEREVVLEEIAMVEDTPHDLVHDIAAEAVFGGHPLGRPVIGRAEVISTVSRRALPRITTVRTTANDSCSPRRATCVTSTSVELLEQRRDGDRASASMPARKPVRRVPPPRLRFQRKDTEQYHACLSAPGIARSDERRFAASVLDAILGGSASSRLFQEIREKRGMAYSVYSYASQYSDAGQIGLYVGTREENLADLSRDRGRRAGGRRVRKRARRGARACQGEPQGPPAALARVDVEPDDAARQVADHGHASARGRGDRPPNRSGDSGRRRGTRRRAALGRIAFPQPGSGRTRAVSRRGRAREPAAALGSRVKIALFGAGGKVGSVLRDALEAAGHEVVDGKLAGPEGCDAAVDFTRPDAVGANVERCLAAGVPVVIGTTGFDNEAVDAAANEAGVPCFHAPNFSQGAVLMMRFAEEAAKVFPRAEIVELHNEAKRDAPSGTAKATAARMGTAPEIHSVRLPGLVAHQEVIFGGPGETLTIRHDTTSREAFVPGVLLALEKVRGLPAGPTIGSTRS